MFSPEERDALYDTFEPGRTDEVSFGLTERGIWHPTPLDVLLPALEAMAGAGWLGSAERTLTILDAGSGDGRVVAALSLASWLSPTSRVLGLESNGQLDTRARARLERLGPKRPTQIARGDFLDPTSYAAFGLRPCDVDVFSNYPDGNEHALAGFVARQAPASTLIVLSPEREPRLEGLPPGARFEVTAPGGAPSWTASRFGPGAETKALLVGETGSHLVLPPQDDS